MIQHRFNIDIYCLFLLNIGLMPCTLHAISQDNPDIKYIMIRKDFNLSRPEIINETKFNELMDHFKDLSDTETKIGIKFIISYFNADVNTIAKSLERILFYAEKTNTPILIKLDGEQWWKKRPDLWNWWDPNKPGYDPNNRNNVEWRWWGPEYALKICWRNWGRQLRVLPPPNLMSPKYRKACHDAMDVLMPIILNWYKTLPEDKKFLFAGLNLGWESSIGINSFYYPNGDQLYDQPEANDPQSGAVRADILSRGVVQQGYAALTTAGIRKSGDVTEEDLYKVVKIHLDDLCKYAHDFGFSRDKIISHGWGNESGELMYDAAVNQYSCPAWSEYWFVDDPGQDQGIMRNIKMSDAPYWGVVEWVLPPPYEKERWKKALSKTLSLPGCKMIGIYWWWFFDKNEEIHDAIREVCLESKGM